MPTGDLPGPGGVAEGSSHQAHRLVPSVNKCSPLFQAVELTAFKSSGNICLHHFLSFLLLLVLLSLVASWSVDRRVEGRLFLLRL